MTKDQKHIILHYRTDAETAKSFDIALSLFHSSPTTQPNPGRAGGWCWLWLPKDIKQIGLHKVQIPGAGCWRSEGLQSFHNHG